MLEGQHFEPAGRLAQFMRMVDAFERDEMETAVDLLIAHLDERDGDPDTELNGDEHDGSASHEETSGFPYCYSEQHAGDAADAEDDDDDTCVDDRGEAGSWAERDAAAFCGSPFADDGDEDDRSQARHAHRDWLRANRCAAISYRGHASADWRLLGTANDLPALFRGSEL